jgi:hypothetical protein
MSIQNKIKISIFVKLIFLIYKLCNYVYYLWPVQLSILQVKPFHNDGLNYMNKVNEGLRDASTLFMLYS